MAIPLIQQIRVGAYVLAQRLKGNDKYPLVLMLEPLFRCNLACAGCGKIDYPDPILNKRLSVRDCLDAVDECGAPVVNSDEGMKQPWTTEAEDFVLMRYTLMEAAKVAEPRKILIGLECHQQYSKTPAGLDRIHKLVKSPAIGINFDTGNTFIAGNDPLEFLKKVRKYVTHVHVKDVSKELADAARGKSTGISASVVHIGGGVNAPNIAKCIDFLTETGWDGVFSIESDGEENVPKSVAWLKEQIARAQSLVKA